MHSSLNVAKCRRWISSFHWNATIPHAKSTVEQRSSKAMWYSLRNGEPAIRSRKIATKAQENEAITWIWCFVREMIPVFVVDKGPTKASMKVMPMSFPEDGSHPS